MDRYYIEVDGVGTKVGSAPELVVILQALLGEEDREVLLQLKNHLAEIIGDSSGLYQVMKALDPENHLFLLELLGEDVRQLFKRADQLSQFLSFLSQPGAKAGLLVSLGPVFLRNLILDPEDLSAILEWIYGEDDMLLLEMLGREHSRSLFHYGSELSIVLHNMDIKTQEKYLDMLGWDVLLDTTVSWKDLALLLRALPNKLSLKYLEGLTDEKLRDVIRNFDEWSKLSKYLEPEEEQYLYNRLGAYYA